MCYPKPGPRCSAHAAAKYAEAHRKVLSAFMTEPNSAKLDRLMKLRNEAEAEYKITPAGIKALEREPRFWEEEKIAELKATRARRIAAVTGDKKVTHRATKLQPYVSTQFSKTGEHLTPMSLEHPDLLSSLKDSEKWSHKLTDEEIATIAWYSESGFADINGHLSVDDFISRNGKKDTTGRLQEAVEVMDSALSKHEPLQTGVILYRRHHFYDEGGHHTNTSVEEAQKHFMVGETFEPNFFMSTSLDPSNTTGGVNLQILSRTGVPVTSISSQGPREYEFLIPRGAKFRVVANDIKMKKKDRKGEEIEVNIIQLEEILAPSSHESHKASSAPF